MARKEIIRKCYVCKKITDEYRFCLNCGNYMCWNHVGRITVSVHNKDGMRETSFYVCQDCIVNKNYELDILTLLRRKLTHTPKIDCIKKIIDILITKIRK